MPSTRLNGLLYLATGWFSRRVTRRCNAAKRGVKCRIMVDSAGVWHFSVAITRKMRAAGIEFVESLKVNLMRFFLRRMDLRQHRK